MEGVNGMLIMNEQEIENRLKVFSVSLNRDDDDDKKAKPNMFN